MATATQAFFRPTTRRRSHFPPQPPAPDRPQLELRDEEFVREWWAHLSPRDVRAVQSIISQRLQWAVAKPNGKDWFAKSLAVGVTWYEVRRRVVSELVNSETDLAEMAYQMEEATYG